MKKLFKKLALMVVALLTFSVGSNYTIKEVKAAEETATLSFASKDQRTSYSTEAQVWEQNGIVFTNEKSSSTNNVADYAKPVRLYANSKIVVSFTEYNISKIVFDANSGSYATALKNSIGNTATASSDKVTVTLDGTSSSFIVAKLTAQVRLDSITVTYVIPEGTPSITISGDRYTEIGKSINLIATTDNLTEELVWSSSDITVATVDQDGKVTAIAMGTTTITATAGDVSGTYDIKVYPVANSVITVSEALSVCDLTGEVNAPFKYSVKGTINEDSLSYSSENSSYTCDIMDYTGVIKAFGIKGEEPLVEGATITVTGSLVTYKGVKEFTYDSTYVIDKVDYISAIKSLNTEASLGFDYTYNEVEDTKKYPITEATLTFDNTSKRTEFSTEMQKWEENGIVFTNEKTTDSSNVADYSNPIRLYKNSLINIEVEAPLSKIVFDSATDEHLTNFKNSITDNKYIENGNLITIELDGTSNIYSLVLSGGQVRFNSITVTYGGSEVTTTIKDYSESTFDNISILFGVEINETYSKVFESFDSVTAGVKFESEGDYLFDRQVTINPENGYSFGVVFEVVPDKTDLSDEVIKERLNTIIKATVYFVVDGTKVELQPSEVSVKSMVETYTTDEKYTSNATVQEYAGALNALKAYIG